MKVVHRKPVREGKKPQMPMWVPAWIKNELGFLPGDEADWFIGEDDNGVKFGGVQRIPKREGEEEEKREGEEEEDGESKGVEK